MATELQVVGKPERKVDAAKLVSGRGTFTDDIFLRGLLHAKILTSPHAHARIVDIDTSAAAALPGVHAAISYKDVRRIPYTTAGQSWPEPSPYDMYILDNKVRFVGDYVAVVAADTPEIAQDALELINVTYESLPAILDMHDSMKPGAPVIHDEPESHGMFDAGRNLAAHIEVEVGNVAEALSESDFVVSEDYFVQYQQHTCLEPHVTIAWMDEDGRLVLRTSTQIPYHCRRMVAFVLDIPVRDVHVIKPRVGGGFGNKQEVITEPLAAVLAMKTGRPVKLEYTRTDEFTIARMRHPQHLTVSIGARRDGSLTATHIKILSNTGPYGTHALTVTGNSRSKTLPLYRSPNIRFDADIVYTNLPISGAFRGYGAPQGFFALEVAIDEMAIKLGRDPLEFRRDNAIRTGDTDPVSEALAEGSAKKPRVMHSNGLPECIERGSAAIGWYTKRRGGMPVRQDEGPLICGIGMCCLMQGSGVAGDELAAATIKMNEDASFTLMLGSADIGTGSDTTLAMIAAEVLGVPLDKILVYSGDTDHVTFDYGAYASSTAYITGQSVLKAAEEARRQIADIAGRMLQEDPEGLLVRDGRVSALNGHSVSLQEIIMESLYGEEKTLIQGRGTHATKESPPPFVAMFAEVEVDIELGVVRPIYIVTAIDVGKALNPAICEGQVEAQ